MAEWRLAKSLAKLRAQVNAAAPNRNKASDGTVGDQAHQHTKSDHNPDGDGVVKAMDITHDPAGGCDCQALADSLVKAKDPRIQYLIWDKRIVNREVQPWVWRPYSGTNPHTKHIHISVDEKAVLYDNDAPWVIALGPAPVPRHRPSELPVPPPDVEMHDPELKPLPGFWAQLFALFASLFSKKG